MAAPFYIAQSIVRTDLFSTIHNLNHLDSSSPNKLLVAAAKSPELLLTLLACSLPPMIGWVQAPVSSALHQFAALLCWGGVIMAAGATWRGRRLDIAGSVPMLGFLALLLTSIAWSVASRKLPLPLALLSVGSLLAGAVLFLAGCAARSLGQAELWIHRLCAGFSLLGLLLSVVCVIQVLAPAWADGDWIARTSLQGRAIGNMRQPNHVASLLCMACLSVIWLGVIVPRFRAFSWLLLALFAFSIVLTASRTGVLCLTLLAALASVDRNVPQYAKASLLWAVLALITAWLAVWAVSLTGGTELGALQRMGEGAASPSRIAVWRDSFELLLREPWTGVGWGEFNRAWTLADFPRRSFVAFDHTHNLPLQLLVELGLPLGLLALAVLAWGLWRAWFSATHHATGNQGLALRCALGLLVVVGIHSQLEFPLWYLYFLLPTAFLLGLCSGHDATSKQACKQARSDRPALRHSNVFVYAGAWLFTTGLVAWADYQRIAPLYEEGSLPMPDRIISGQQARLFGPWADRVYVDVLPDSSNALEAIQRSSHLMVDVRLLMRWAVALDREGQTDKARYIAMRVRDFRDPAVGEWLARCTLPGGSPPRWCGSPSRNYSAADY